MNLVHTADDQSVIVKSSLEMARLQAFYLFLVLKSVLSAVPHSHSHGGGERMQDGARSPKDHGHYKDGVHDASFDHEAILGSTREAEEFDQLSPDEAKKRLSLLVDKMDESGDGLIDKTELKNWILASFKSLSKEESSERFEDSDLNRDGVVTWLEYRQEEFDIDEDEDVENLKEDPERLEELAILEEDQILFEAADKDQNESLTKEEFLSFTHPEEDAEMIRPALERAKQAKDKNNDGKIDFQEFVGDRGKDQSKDWLLGEKERFDEDLDKNQDGSLDDAEIIAWVIPDSDEIASDEVNHLFAGADEDVDGLLSKDEILNNHDLFVGGEVTNYGEMLRNKEEL